MLFIHLLVLIAAAHLSFARLGHGLRGPRPHVVKHGMCSSSFTKRSSGDGRRAPISRREAPAQTSCGSGSQISIKAPKVNIFAGLTDDEAATVTSFLHDQKSLNLTAAANATR